MKKRIYLMALLIIVSIYILYSVVPVSAKSYQIPETIRVGLFYQDSSVNTALSIFDITSGKGLIFGFSEGNTFTEILSENFKRSGNSTIYVRKDTFYYDDGGALKEYSPGASSAKMAESKNKYGPFHIQIGSNLPDAQSAKELVNSYRKLGIQAFIAYNDAWQIWAGMYESEKEAMKDMENIKGKQENIDLCIVSPNATGVMVVDSKFQPLCAFSSNKSYLLIKPAPESDPPVINIKGKPYRGSLEVRRPEGGNMTVINIVTMQEYLYGNVPAEIGGKSPAEAIKAQAVASKMYAINNIGKHAKSGFDLCPTTSCQVYKGYSAEVPECNKAIDEVKDKIITYNGEPAKQIFYFASSGGRTEDVRNVWGSSYPYLVSVEDKYEKIYTWTKTLSAEDVKARIPQLGNILGISITKTAESGRVTQLAVRGEKSSEPAIYNLEKTRTIFGLNSQLYTITTDADVYMATLAYSPTVTAGASADIKAGAGEKETTISPPVKAQFGGKVVITASGKATLKGSGKKVTILGADGKTNKVPLTPETYTFTGKGWGHAVGMSQEGAIGMAKAGFKFDEILTHYFQGTKIE